MQQPSLFKAVGSVVIGLVGIAFALHAVATGVTTVVPDRSSVRSSYAPRSYTVTRKDDPLTFWVEVGAAFGGSLYLFYTVIAGASRD